jgi:hypothetical protein
MGNDPKPASGQYNLEQMYSLNGNGNVTLSDGQTVKFQVTFRHGMTAERAMNDFEAFVATLNLMALEGVEFEPGKPGKMPEPPVQKIQERDETGAPVVDENHEPKMVDLPHDVHVFTVSQVFHDQTKGKMDVMKVVTVEKPYNTKYGVTCFHPPEQFEGWRSWTIGTRFSPPVGAGHVVIRDPSGEAKWADVVEFRE